MYYTYTHTHIQEIEKYLWSECDQCKTELQTWAVPCIWVLISLSATPTPYTRRGRTIAVFIDKKDTMFQNAYGIYKAGNSVGGKIPGTQRREYIATQQSN